MTQKHRSSQAPGDITARARPTTRGRGAIGRRVALALAIVIAPAGLAACGEDDASSDAGGAQAAPTPLAITTSAADADRFTTTAPATVSGGLVELTFTNADEKATHEAQLVRIDGDHTAQDAVEVVTGDSVAIPDWFHAAGGAGSTGPGQTVTTTMNLPAGSYAMIDNDAQEGPSNSSRGALAEFEVTAGDDGDLPAATATITADTADGAEHDNSFEIEGLKVGPNRVKLVNTGEEVHHAVLFPILPGKTLADVKKAFTEERPSGPPPVDFAGAAGTAAIDGDSELVTDLVLRKPGTYAVVCFLTDRDGKGEQHLAEGMIEKVVVK